MKTSLVILLLIVTACSTTQMGSSAGVDANTFATDNPAMSLADYLKRVPGIQVIQAGGKVMVTVRGNNSVGGQLEPLFVINGVNVGFGYENAEPLVAVTDIDYVRVLKSGQESAQYGVQGNNGVILIKTKR